MRPKNIFIRFFEWFFAWEREDDQLRNKLNLALRSWKNQVRVIRDDRDEKKRERDDARKDAEYSRQERIEIERDRDKANDLVIINDLKRLKQLNEMQIQRDEARRCNANQLDILNQIYAIADPKQVMIASEIIGGVKDTFVEITQLRKLLELAQTGRLQTEYKSDKLREVCDKLADAMDHNSPVIRSGEKSIHYHNRLIKFSQALAAYSQLPHVSKLKGQWPEEWGGGIGQTPFQHHTNRSENFSSRLKGTKQ